MNLVAASSQISEAMPECESPANAIRLALVYGYLVPPVRISATFGRPIHPGRLRCSSVTYVEYAPSSRLAVRASRPPKHDRSSDRRH